jgi:hypothetical protein
MPSLDPNLPTITPPRKHKWNPPVTILPSESFDGNERTERVCEHCGLTKITVHVPHGFPWREWRVRGGEVTIPLTTTPPCLVAKDAAA